MNQFIKLNSEALDQGGPGAVGNSAAIDQGYPRAWWPKSRLALEKGKL